MPRTTKVGPLEAAVRSGVDNAFQTPNIMVSVYLRRLKAVGLKTTKADRKRFLAAFEEAKQANTTWVTFRISDKRLERIGISAEAFREIVQRPIGEDELLVYMNKVQEVMPAAADKAAHAMSEAYVRYAMEEGEQLLQERQETLAHFHANVHAIWGEALDRLDVMVNVAREIGEKVDYYWRRKRRRKRSLRMVVLHRLNARACCIGSEIVALLRHGYAGGASARWRSLHEVAVVAILLAEGDDELAQRYVDHRAVSRYQTMQAYVTHRTALGLRPLSLKAQVKNKAMRDAVVKRHGGKPFAAPYGWASQLAGHAVNSFEEVERLANLSALRPYYKAASQSVHATTQGTLEPEGAPRGTTTLLSGPSDFGLDGPGQLTANSLIWTTSTLMIVQPSMEAAAFLGVMPVLGRACAKSFSKSWRHLQSLIKSRKNSSARFRNESHPRKSSVPRKRPAARSSMLPK